MKLYNCDNNGSIGRAAVADHAAATAATTAATAAAEAALVTSATDAAASQDTSSTWDARGLENTEVFAGGEENWQDWSCERLEQPRQESTVT